MIKVSRKAIGCLLTTEPGGDIPSLGIHILNRISHPESGITNTLDLTSEYYESIEELSDKGLIRLGPNGYCLTEEGRLFLFRLRGSKLQNQKGSTSQGPDVVSGSTPPPSQNN